MSILRQTYALGGIAGGNHLTADNDEPEREPFYESVDRAGLARTAGEAEEVAYRAALLFQIRRASVEQVTWGAT